MPWILWKPSASTLVGTIEALRESESHLRPIVDGAVDGIISIDEHGTVEWLNAAALRIFGYAAEEIVGANVRLLMPEPYHSEHDGYLSHYRRTGQRKIIGIGREVVGRRKNGSTFPMDLAVSEAWLGERRVFTGIVRDITERKAAAQTRTPGDDGQFCQHRVGGCCCRRV